MSKIENFFTDENQTVLQAMELLDKLAKKVMFITNDSKLIAAFTDGDIRRWILKKGKLNASVKNAANYNPRFLYEKDKASANDVMKRHSIEAIPIVDEDKRIVSIVLWNEKIIEERKVLDLPVVIMAGGFGTRLYPYTKILPKPLVPIGEIPIVEHIMNRFHKYGCTDFHLIVNYKKNMIKAYFNEIDTDYTISYADEDTPLGTGGGLSLLKGKITTSFFLSNCDVLIYEDYEKIYKHHKDNNNLVTMVCSLRNYTIPYGVIDIDEKGQIVRMKEKPKLSFFTNAGVYIVEPKVIDELEENKSIGFPDIINGYMQAGEKVGVYPICENAWLDMGQIDEMEKMRKRLEQD